MSHNCVCRRRGPAPPGARRTVAESLSGANVSGKDRPRCGSVSVTNFPFEACMARHRLHRSDPNPPMSEDAGLAPAATLMTYGAAFRSWKSAPAEPDRAGRGCGWPKSVLTLLLLCNAAPSFGGPDAAGGAATGCWTRDGAPALFSWSAAPGIACRDLSDGSNSSGSSSATLSDTQDTRNSAAVRQSAQITFSANAYVGIAAAF